MEEEYSSEGTNERHKDEAIGNIWNTNLRQQRQEDSISH